ncbi:MAG: glutamine-hydrolyzing carbamoyl-phosphate synthase small subunit [Deltaproteobacteria bacterium]|nr:glutamine-hydrolyzing carbamoyl-phosphate synthase small subunit [Deltaproteobacteria bacterium]MBW2360471.1 glutamine-hydrolyzing carbamoyl-phosphate synthase small subunit [Deltaproteobacteria bacterium]
MALADGTVFRGIGFGARTVDVGEVCFNTSMTGYQEILTDPSYAGQLVTMTYTQIGNVGVNSADEESSRPFLSGFIVREHLDVPSNWRAQESLGAYLERHGVPGLAEIDTRALVRRIRDEGFQLGAISTDPAQQDAAALVERARRAPGLDGRDLASEVSCSEPYSWSEGRWPGVAGQCPRPQVPTPQLRLVAYDFGIKRNILRRLVEHGFEVTVVPARTPAAEALAFEPHGIFLSNGPGDPAGVAPSIFEAVRELAERLPVFGICLGHQILALSLGGRTRKLKFGHHGGNQPGQDRKTGKVAICAENHGYAVDAESLEAAGEPVDVTHVNLNDNTVEGLAHRLRPLFSVQYHPEASPGPHDAAYFFRRFRTLVERHHAGEAVTGVDVAAGEVA